jgi:hypothetical protein
MKILADYILQEEQAELDAIDVVDDIGYSFASAAKRLYWTDLVQKMKKILEGDEGVLVHSFTQEIMHNAGIDTEFQSYRMLATEDLHIARYIETMDRIVSPLFVVNSYDTYIMPDPEGQYDVKEEYKRIIEAILRLRTQVLERIMKERISLN